MRVVVTGAAGFIGSNLVHGLNRLGIDDIVAVDDLTDGPKFVNLRQARIADYFDKDAFYSRFATGDLGRFDVVFHQGACSDTMQHNGRLMMDSNHRCSKDLLDACQAAGTALIYASSAAVYGGGSVFVEDRRNEAPLNVYGWSKQVFDDAVRLRLPRATAQVAGLRYFNVYGPREQHKQRMASVAFHLFNEFRATGAVSLFGAYGGFGAGMQRRDFVHVDDVVAVNLWLLQHPQVSGIFNVGSGRAQCFNEVACAVVNRLRQRAGEGALDLPALVAAGLVRYTPFPQALVGKYQCHTEADLSRLRASGCPTPFLDVATGVAAYVDWLCEV